MDHVLSALASTFTYLNPVQFARELSPQAFVLAAQAGTVLALSGFTAIGLRRAGFPDRVALAVALAAILTGTAYLVLHRGNAFGMAEWAVALFGSVFRFAGGVGVAVGAVILIGVRIPDRPGFRQDLGSPMVLTFTALYAWLCVEAMRTVGAGSGHGLLIWAGLSILACWISFAGILNLVRRSCWAPPSDRFATMIAAGCIGLVFLTFLHTPYSEEHRLLYSGSFPAGVFVGAVTVVVRI